MNNLWKATIICFLAFIVVSGTISAMELTIKGESSELQQFLSTQFNKDVFGAKIVQNIKTHGSFEASGNSSSTFANAIIPKTTAIFDIGEASKTWRNAYISGTLNASSTVLSGNILPDI